MLLFNLLAFGATISYGEVIGIHALKSSSTPLFKGSAIATRSSSAVPSTITTGPTVPVAAINTCSYYNETEQRTLWADPWCSMYAGMVDLVYWPTDNQSYPSTFYDHKHDYTYSSPSVYMVVSTLYGWNPCGLLGPSTSREVFAFDLTEVSTLVPYTALDQTARRATRQLYLSDLGAHCSTDYNKTELATQTHPMKSDDTRCNPFLAVPVAVKRYGYPYWLHCGVSNNKFGLFDPPYAIPPVDDLVPTKPPTTTTSASDASETENTTAATSASTKATAPTNPEATESATTTANPVNPSSSDSSLETTNPAPVDPESTKSNNPGTSAGGGTVIVNPGNTETTAANPGDSHTTAGAPGDDGNSHPTATTNPPHTIVTGTEGQFDPTDYTSGVLSTSSTQVVSLGPGGVVVINPDSGDTITTGSGNTMPGATTVYNGQTLTLGGPAVTVTNVIVVVSPGYAGPTGGANTHNAASTVPKQVVSLGAGGLVILNPDTGIAITSVYGNAVPTTAVYNGQTLSLGGQAVTVTNAVGDAAGFGPNADGAVPSNQIVSLGAGGLVIVNPDTGIIVTSGYGTTVPTTAVYSGQTLTLGGPAVTVTNIANKSVGSANVFDISLGSATSTTAVAGSGHAHVGGASSGHADLIDITHVAGSSFTPIASSSVALDSSANKIAGGLFGLLLALMTSIWV
ncbi:hypothetical protein N7517_011389 [Penicillium concentricum]|uniref:Uncharacterized protein n=1 Tax=Penicillium concentricum TaxID=293559 RepID=A0A9W9RAP5_9EURO|nr:uncharacterized protein N7517_011389 [Penicillium concentricum]KAJ5356780.1 hypothetical protein N7517_011389 [Penicillium concentricum]